MRHWSDLAYLEVEIRDPATRQSVLVRASLEPGPFFGLYADLAEDVIAKLGIVGGVEFKGGYDDGEIISFCTAPVEIRLGRLTVTGLANINSKTRDTTLFGHFLDEIPDDMDLSSFGKLALTRSVFLSHSHEDKPFVRALAKSLKARGIGVWVDEAEIRVGDSLITRLRAAIDCVDYVIAVLSPASVKSVWVQKELDIAMTQEIEGRRLKVLPLLKADCELPGFLMGKLFADFRKKSARRRALEKVVDTVRAWPGQ